LGVNLTEYDIEKNATKKREMHEKSGKESIPFIDVEGIYIHGFSEKAIKRAVEKRRSM